MKLTFSRTSAQRQALRCIGVWLLAALASGCSNDIRTFGDVARATGHKAERAAYWQMRVRVAVSRDSHLSQWEGVIYSDGTRYACMLNGASGDKRVSVQIVIDGAGTKWIEIEEAGATRLYTVAHSRVRERAAFLLPGNLDAGIPLGMFLDPADALKRIDERYDTRLMRRSNIEGDLIFGFTGTLKPETLSELDPEGYLAGHDLPIGDLDVAIRALDGAVRRVQFLDNGFPFISVDYYEVNLNPERDDSRFEYTPLEGLTPVDVTDRALSTVCGFSDSHTLFTWDEEE